MRPAFDFYLDLGILRIHTAIWHDSINDDAREFVMFFFEVWRKQIFRFRLYETGMSRMMRMERSAYARLVDDNGIINVGEFTRLWNKDRVRMPSLHFLCGVCLRNYFSDEAAAKRCHDSHPPEHPPTTEDR